ncbi:MAG: thioesterase family protein [Gordonia sp. (in: high G+C Gram-positive bacteria)]
MPVRWSDMDAFGHINHARVVTLMEEARIEWLRTGHDGTLLDPSAQGTPGAGGDLSSLIMSAMIVHVDIRYQAQLRHEDSPLRISMWIKEFRSVDFTIGYEIRSRRTPDSARAACVASTQMAVVDIEAHTLRRLTATEKDQLRAWSR